MRPAYRVEIFSAQTTYLTKTISTVLRASFMTVTFTLTNRCAGGMLALAVPYACVYYRDSATHVIFMAAIMLTRRVHAQQLEYVLLLLRSRASAATTQL